MASTQNYRNHIRYYPPHHFVFLPLSAAAVLGSAYCAWHYPADRPVWIGITAAAILIFFLGTMLRQHYALGNQNRIVRLEMRLRYYQLTGERFEQLESRLGFGRIAALRFAGDNELFALIQQALSENLSAGDIKQRIKNWQPDEMRV